MRVRRKQQGQRLLSSRVSVTAVRVSVLVDIVCKALLITAAVRYRRRYSDTTIDTETCLDS
jgi:hypothetical protein